MPKPFKIVTAEQVIEMLKGRKYKYAQVHHTWKPTHKSFNGKNHIQLQENMLRSHLGRGFSDIAQHLTLMPDGTFVTGRNFNVAPAGITGKNTGSFMIEILGNFDLQSNGTYNDLGYDKLEGKQLETALKVYQYLVNHCGAKIIFHRDFAPKSCPGTSIDYNWFVNMVKNYSPNKPKQVEEDDEEMKLEAQWQYDALEQALRDLYNDGTLNSLEWAEKAKKKTLTNSELSWLNIILLSRIKK